MSYPHVNGARVQATDGFGHPVTPVNWNGRTKDFPSFSQSIAIGAHRVRTDYDDAMLARVNEELREAIADARKLDAEIVTLRDMVTATLLRDQIDRVRSASDRVAQHLQRTQLYAGGQR